MAIRMINKIRIAFSIDKTNDKRYIFCEVALNLWRNDFVCMSEESGNNMGLWKARIAARRQKRNKVFR
jgi:hypothetical protein